MRPLGKPGEPLAGMAAVGGSPPVGNCLPNYIKLPAQKARASEAVKDEQKELGPRIVPESDVLHLETLLL